MKVRLIALLVLVATLRANAFSKTAVAPAAPSAARSESLDAAATYALLLQTAKMEQRARCGMLGALTAPHRALLAQTIGTLAVTSDPDLDAAAARLDAVLGPSELRTIHRMAEMRRDQFASNVFHVQHFEPSMTLEQFKQVFRTRSNPPRSRAMQSESDPGYVLLRTALSGLQSHGRPLKARVC